MEPGLLLDTHILLWLYMSDYSHYSPKAKQLLSKPTYLYTSPISLLELDFLYECKKTIISSTVILEYLSTHIGLTLRSDPIGDIVTIARDLSWTRDPFDRLIAATALLNGIPLLTKDRVLRKHCPKAVW